MKEELFKAGYEWGLQSNVLTSSPHGKGGFKESFREGFRKAKLELRELRRQQGIVSFPGTSEGSIKIKNKQ